MSKLKWNWVYYPYLDPPEKQKESALKAGYNKVYLKSEVDKVIADLEAKLESVQASAYVESVDAGMRERKLKRALWLARATIAHSTKYKYHRLSCKAEIDPQLHGWSCYINGEVYRTGKMNRKVEPHYWIEIWEEVERKCRAKAEEYK